jgi:hypothetical protein
VEDLFDRKRIKNFAIFLKELDSTIVSKNYVENFIDRLVFHKVIKGGGFWMEKKHKSDTVLMLKVYLCKKGWLPEFDGNFEETGKEATKRLTNLPKNTRFMKIRVSNSKKNTALVPLKQFIDTLKHASVNEAFDSVTKN